MRVKRAESANKARTGQPLREVRAQQEEGDHSADYLILAREQIVRTLLATEYFTADDLEPLGIPQEYRRSVHGSATGYFSGEEPFMDWVGRRKSERPQRKGGKNDVFHINAKGRRELPKLLAGMNGPVRDAKRRLYGESVGMEGGGVASSAAGDASLHSGELAPPSEEASGTSTLQVPDASPEPLTLLPHPPAMFDPDPRAA